MKKTRWAPLLALMLVVLGLFVAACGDDEDEGGNGGAAPEEFRAPRHERTRAFLQSINH